MHWYRNLKLGTQLITAFLAVAILTALMGFIGMSYVRKIDAADTFMYERTAVPLGQMARIQGNWQETRVHLNRGLLVPDVESAKAIFALIPPLERENEEQLAGYAKTFIDAADEAAWRKMKDETSKFHELMQPIIARKLAGKPVNLEEMTSFAKAAGEISAHLDEVVDANVKAARETSDANTKLANSAVSFMQLFTVAGAALGILLGWAVTRIIKRQVGGEPAYAVDILQRVADGDLSMDIRRRRGTPRAWSPPSRRWWPSWPTSWARCGRPPATLWAPPSSSAPRPSPSARAPRNRRPVSRRPARPWRR